MQIFEIYSDGACSNNPGPGGYGVYLTDNNEFQFEVSSGHPNTTNNRMELLGMIHSLVIALIITKHEKKHPQHALDFEHVDEFKKDLISSLISGASGLSGTDFFSNDNEMQADNLDQLLDIAYLKELKLPDYDDYYVKIYTDSKYVCDGIKSWLSAWKKNNWRNAAKKPVKNKDLWLIIDALWEKLWTTKNNISLDWVKAHAGNEGNERADYLACSAISDQS